MFIAGDVGGTKTRLAIYTVSGSEFATTDIKQFESRNYPSPQAMILEFLKGCEQKPSGICLGVPGPVVDGMVRVTNLPWVLGVQEISEALGGTPVKLVNDLVATAAGAIQLFPSEVEVIRQGTDNRPKDMWAVVAPGTGLGQASIYYTGGVPRVLPSEGGHSDFAPLNDLQIDLFNFLRKKLGKRVSVERLVCGPGLINIYSFFRDTGLEKEPQELSELFVNRDPAAVIGEHGIKKDFPICVRALETFISILGAHCGNCVLTYMATGGLYLGGGIPPKVITADTQDIFLSAFLDKGRLSHLLEATPVYLIKDDTTALKGAAAFAAGQVLE